MKIIRPDLLKQFHRFPKCELCGAVNFDGLDPHHCVIKRGMGGGKRIDDWINLAALCRLPCHRKAEDGKLPPLLLVDIIATREGIMYRRSIPCVLHAIARLRKDRSNLLEVERDVFEQYGWSGVNLFRCVLEGKRYAEQSGA